MHPSRLRGYARGTPRPRPQRRATAPGRELLKPEGVVPCASAYLNPQRVRLGTSQRNRERLFVTPQRSTYLSQNVGEW
jgi:hypothetical protein